MIQAEHTTFDSQIGPEIELLDKVPGIQLPQSHWAIKVSSPSIFLVCSIFEPKDIGNCSNYGTTYRRNTLLVVLDPGEVERFLGHEVVLLAWAPSNSLLVKAVPLHILRSGGHSMHGGCYVSTSDSRFPFHYPVPVHDREEQ
jgi:hypothetical protein